MEEGTILDKAIVNKFFRTIRTQSCNKICADCSRNSPIWTTITYGFFICSDCAAKHRSLGVKISMVKNTLLDKWTLGELRRMYVSGNGEVYKLGNEKDLRIKYSSAQWYKEEVNSRIVGSISNEPGMVFIERLTEKESNIVEHEVKEIPLPRFSDKEYHEEEQVKTKVLEPERKIEQKRNDTLFIKKKSTPNLSKNKQYEVDDSSKEISTGRLGFGSVHRK